MNDVTMKATVFAKKLRTQLAKDRKMRVTALRRYDIMVDVWRKMMKAWLRATAEARVNEITKKDLKEHTGRYHRNVPFNTEAFFRGAPEPPKFPSDERIRDIQRALHHIAITGQATIKVSESDTKKYFGEDEEDEDC